MEWRFLQCLKESIRHMRSHPVCSRQDADTTLPFVGPVSQFLLQLPDLIDLDVLSLRFNDQDVGMKTVINLLARNAMITGVSSLALLRDSSGPLQIGEPRTSSRSLHFPKKDSC